MFDSVDDCGIVPDSDMINYTENNKNEGKN